MGIGILKLHKTHCCYQCISCFLNAHQIDSSTYISAILKNSLRDFVRFLIPSIEDRILGDHFWDCLLNLIVFKYLFMYI